MGAEFPQCGALFNKCKKVASPGSALDEVSGHNVFNIALYTQVTLDILIWNIL